MRKYVIAGNWKMNKTPAEATALINDLKPLVAGASCDVVVGVPFVDLPAALEARLSASPRRTATGRNPVPSPARFPLRCSRPWKWAT